MFTVEQMVQHEVLCCVSKLVATLAQTTSYVCPRKTEPNARENAAHYDLCIAAQELAKPVLDYEKAATQVGWVTRPATVSADGIKSDACVVRGTTADDPEYVIGFKYAESWTDACKADGIEPYEWKVFEHWAVSSWLAEKLIAQGERVDTDFAGLNVWARTITDTDRGIACDGVMQRIHANMVEGKK
jgi:hypothetical protein